MGEYEGDVGEYEGEVGEYEGELGDMAFWRAEGTMQMWEDVRADGSEAGGSGDKNSITAELGSVTGTLSVGMKF